MYSRYLVKSHVSHTDMANTNIQFADTDTSLNPNPVFSGPPELSFLLNHCGTFPIASQEGSGKNKTVLSAC